MRLWTAAFREAGLEAGDRIVIALPPSAAFVQSLLAAFWNGLTVAVVAPRDAQSAAGEVDARLTISDPPGPAVWVPVGPNGPSATCQPPQPGKLPPSPQARLLQRTSGTTAAARWIALSDSNLFAVLDSHMPALGLAGARVFSALPWHHVFGLILDLLVSLLSGAEIVRESTAERNPAATIRAMQEWQSTHVSGVPYFFRGLADSPGGINLLRQLEGGIIGGAPVDRSLSAALRGTRFRIGYGLTEASPGVCLGAPGALAPYSIGEPLGCELMIGSDNQAHFRGSNAHLGLWTTTGLDILASDRWVPTGDIVREADGRVFYAGRTDDRFKLDNGRWIDCGVFEDAVRSRCADVEHALLISEDGRSVSMLWSASADMDCASNVEAEIENVLAPLGCRLNAIRKMDRSEWARTPKGDIDRKAYRQKSL